MGHEGARKVDLTGAPAPDDDALYDAALACRHDVGAALAVGVGLSRTAPRPGGGRTIELWQSLATLGAADVTTARVIEPQLDAAAILDEAASPALTELGVDADSTWGVFAAEGGGLALDATRTPEGWTLSGAKPWCSLGDRLSHALVTARYDGGERGLFAVRLDGTVTARSDAWFARGLAEVPSGPLDFDGSAAIPVGDAGWYLRRPGFAWGGIGVAAVWWGGAVGIARTLRTAIAGREPDQVALMHIGAVDRMLWSGRAVLREAAVTVDTAADGGAPTDADDARLLAARVRGAIAETAERVIAAVGHALGPAPLALDDRHAGRVADLGLYVRQHHAERDDAALGRLVAATGPSW